MIVSERVDEACKAQPQKPDVSPPDQERVEQARRLKADAGRVFTDLVALMNANRKEAVGGKHKVRVEVYDTDVPLAVELIFSLRRNGKIGDTEFTARVEVRQDHSVWASAFFRRPDARRRPLPGAPRKRLGSFDLLPDIITRVETCLEDIVRAAYAMQPA